MIKKITHLFFFLLLFLLLSRPSVFGADNTPIDWAHARISKTVNRTAQWFDRFFATPNEQDEAAYSFLIFKNIFDWIESDGVEYSPRFKLKVHLPGTKRRFNLLLEQDDRDDLDDTPDEIITDGTNPVPLEENSRNRSISLGFTALKKLGSRIDFRAGLRSGNAIETSGRLRRRFNLTKKLQNRIVATTFWRDREGFGQRGNIDFDQRINPRLLLSWINSGRHSEEVKGINWHTALNLSYALWSKGALVFTSAANGQTRPKRTVQNYVLGTLYRQNFYRKWLFFEVQPSINFPRVDEHFGTSVLTLSFRLEVVFREDELGQRGDKN